MASQKRAYNRTVTGRDPHGLSRTPLYRIWGLIKHRTRNPNNPQFHYYGGRGIAMCDEWADSFMAFYRDMGDRPTPQHSIDRIDNDGPYSPENCRWATPKEQANNSRHNRRLEYDGQLLTISEWAQRTGIKRRTLQMRLDSCGWSVERALTTPVGGGRHL